MQPKLRESRGGEITRRRILEAALARFRTASYEDVRLRDIATEVGVDVALVHRAFGSKEQLFSAVLMASRAKARQTPGDPGRLSAEFAEGFFDPGADETLQILVRSMTNPQARKVLRGLSLSEFIGPIAATLEGASKMERATLLNACLVGIAIFRHVLEVETLADDNRAKMRPLIERILDACLAAEEASPASAPKADAPAPRRSAMKTEGAAPKRPRKAGRP